MTLTLDKEMVWQEIEKQLFAVLGMVTANQEARTVGIVYLVDEYKLYIGTSKKAWKTRHIQQNPNVSLTIPIPKRIPIMPWIKIPSATISFSGKAQVLDLDNIPDDLLYRIYRGLEIDEAFRQEAVVIAVEPVGEFITYGVGVSLMTMRTPEKARGRAAVS